MSRLYGLLVLAMLSGCAGFIPGKTGEASKLSFFNTYEAALNDYKKGRVMTARARILAMDKTREDYPRALKLLKQKVEPARLRLLRHYSAKAKAAEKSGEWSRAMSLYAQAAELSTKPLKLKKKSSSMEMMMRQARMDALIAQRRAEDSKLLAWLHAYEPPKGVAPKDEVFKRARKHVQDIIEDRGALAYREAKRYLNRKLPEIAYIEAESYLRFVPNSERGKRLLADIKVSLPKAIRITPLKSGERRLSRRAVMPKTVSSEQVTALIHKGEWIEAKKYALVYRREGGRNAEQLLKQIQTNMEREAATLFARGRVAFRQEQLDLAIGFWEKAVALMPEHSEYVDALRRARQLQERLRVLRSDSETGKTQK